MISLASIFCILPPHILSEISQRGTSRQKEVAWRTLRISHQFRSNHPARWATGCPGQNWPDPSRPPEPASSGGRLHTRLPGAKNSP